MPASQPARRPLIAIVGSLDDSRHDYHPPLRGVVRDGVRACEQLGLALAAAGCDLLVFSSKPQYVEAHVVRGYTQASGADLGCVVARPPRNGTVAFDLPGESNTRIIVQPDASGEWELSYYRSLTTADGIVLVGGGPSTRIAGIIALTSQVPILPVAAFGGGAGQVWVNLDKERNDAAPDEIVRMGQPWSAELAEQLIASLLAQRDRQLQRGLDQVRGREGRARTARTALASTLAALVVAWLGAPFAGIAGFPAMWNLLLLLALPMVASAAGALLRNFNRQDHWGWAAARGLAAGLVTVFIYIAGQLVTVPDLLARLDPQRLIFFLIPLGFAAGFAFDKVLEAVLSGRTKVPDLHEPPYGTG